MMSVIKFRSLFLALFVFTASGYGQAEQTELTPKCGTPTVEGEPACWMKAENHDNCYIWNSYVRDEQTVTWSGQCRAGKARGRGKATWEARYYRDDGDITTLVYNNTGSYVDGKKHGRWEEQELHVGTGTLFGVWTGRYINGKRQGQSRFKSTDGTITHTGPYVDGLANGQWEERYSDRVERGSYVDGKRHGPWVEKYEPPNYENIHTVARGSYVDGKKQGPWVEKYPYDNRGYSYIDPYVDGKRHGVQKAFKYGDLAYTCNYYQGVKQSCDHDP